MPSWTFTNAKGETVTTSRNRGEILSRFGGLAKSDSWLWFHIVSLVEGADKPSTWGLQEASEFLADSFLLALGMPDAKGGHLKKPMIRCHYGPRRFKFYLSGRGSLCLKSGAIDPGTKDPMGDEEYVGCLYQGKFLPGKDGYNGRVRSILPPEQEFLDALCGDPAGFLAKCAADMGRCVYCNAPLSDEKSLRAKCGQICAVRWGIPWTDRDYEQKVPSFADLWRNASAADRGSIRGVCHTLRECYSTLLKLEVLQRLTQTQQEQRESIRSEIAMLWGVLGDALEEAGYSRRPTPPERGVVIPAA